jgi:hypothetical protein
VLKGYIDGIASSGYIDGWAFDSDRPLDPLTIGICDEHEQEIAWGLAHLFRDDLSAAGCAAGWCAFRVRTAASVSRLKKQALTLFNRSSKEAIVRRFPVPYTEDWDRALATIDEVVASDPTTISSILQLKGCHDTFSAFMYTHGVDAFIRAAYVYALGRPADPSGLASYGQKIRKNLLTPFQLLEIMVNSDEFRSRTRLLAAPNTRGFPFRHTPDD